MKLPIASMTTAEKLEAMDQLWASLQIQDDARPPEWHSQILTWRQERINRGETTFSTLDEVRKRLEKRDC